MTLPRSKTKTRTKTEATREVSELEFCLCPVTHEEVNKIESVASSLSKVFEALFQAGNLELTRLLLSHGSDASIQDGEGESPLMWAAEGGHTHVARLLVQHHANITVKSEDGRWVANKL